MPQFVASGCVESEEIHSTEKTIDQQHLVTELNNFFDFWLKLSRLLPEQFQQMDFDGKNFQQCFDGLRTLLEEVVTAMEGHDFVLAADLLQYEVISAIETIQSRIPELKVQLGEVEVEQC